MAVLIAQAEADDALSELPQRHPNREPVKAIGWIDEMGHATRSEAMDSTISIRRPIQRTTLTAKLLPSAL